MALAPAASAYTNVGPVGYGVATTWDLAGSPYYVNGPVNALNDLAIDAGVQVLFNCTCQIQISGSIHINGNETDPVVFASNNTSAVPFWGGIQIINPAAASSVNFAVLDRPQVGIDILQANQGVDITNVTITNASTWGINARLLHQTSAWTNITVGDSASGVNLDDVTLLTFRNYRTYNLTGVAAYALQGNRVGTSDFFDFAFPGSRMRLVDSATITVTTIAVSSSVWPTGIELTRPNTITMTGVQVRGFTSEGVLSVGAIAETLVAVDIAPLGAVQAATGLAFDASPGFQVSGGTISNGTVGLSAEASRDFVADNLTVGHAATGVRATDSPAFTLDNCSISNATSVALLITRSGDDAHVRNVGINTSALGVRVVGSGTQLAIDFSQGNYINNAPVLGVYNQPGTNVNPANQYAWVFVYGSPNTQITGASVQAGAGDPALVWAASDFGQLAASIVVGGFAGVVLGNSNSMTMTGVDAFSPQYALWAYGSGLLTVQDSRFESTGDWGAIMDNMADSQFQNVTGIGPTGGLQDYVGFNNHYLNSFFNGSQAALIRLSRSVSVEATSLCSAGTQLFLNADQDIVAQGNTHCPGSAAVAVRVQASVRTLVENTSFADLGVAVDIDAASDTTVRWNEFRNCSIAGVRGGATHSGARIFENNFFCGGLSASDQGGVSNEWYSSSRGHGNFWDNYAGVDANSDFIGDSPFNIPGGARRDLFPLFVPYEKAPPTAIVSVTSPIDEDTSSVLNGSLSVDNVAIAGGFWVIHDASGDVTRQGVVVNYFFETPGFFRCDFTVRDAWNNTAGGTAYVRVNDKTPPVFTSNPGPFAVDEDQPITFYLQLTDNDPGFPGGASFVWTVTGRENATATTQYPAWTPNFAQPGRYFGNVTAFDAGGNTASASFDITVRDVTAPTIDARFTGSVPPGQGETMHMTMAFATDNDLAFPGPGAFTWIIVYPENSGFVEDFNQSMDFTPTVPGNYSITYECRDPTGNVQRGQYVFWAGDTAGPLWTAPANFTAAEGSNTTFSAADAVDFSGVASATWTDGGTVVSLELEFTRTWTRLGEHPIIVILVDSEGNDATFAFVVTVVDATPPRLLNLTFVHNVSVRQEARIEFDAFGHFADNDPAFPSTVKYNWSTDAGNVTWGSPRDSSHVVLAISTLGKSTLTLRVTDAAGNVVELVFNVTVSDGLAPTGISWSVAPNMTFVIGTTATFTAFATDPSGVFFRWEFGDGEQAEGAAVSYKYVSTGQWTVTLHVSDSLGNEQTRTFTLSVREVPPGSNNGGGGGGGGGGGQPQGLSLTMTLIIVAVVAAAGVAAMGLAFRKRLKRPAQPQTVIIQQAAPGPADPWAKPPPSEYDALYGPSPSGPNEGPPPPQ